MILRQNSGGLLNFKTTLVNGYREKIKLITLCVHIDVNIEETHGSKK